MKKIVTISPDLAKQLIEILERVCFVLLKDQKFDDLSIVSQCKAELSKEIDASLTAIATLKETEGKFAAEESRRGLVEKMEKGWLVDIPF